MLLGVIDMMTDTSQRKPPKSKGADAERHSHPHPHPHPYPYTHTATPAPPPRPDTYWLLIAVNNIFINTITCVWYVRVWCVCGLCTLVGGRKLSWKFLSAKNVYGSLDNTSQVSVVRDSFAGISCLRWGKR